MYKIIGADRKEYGPVTGDQVRQWIAEGRANGQTLAQAEGSTEWQPLLAFPEFAQSLGAGGPGAAPPPLAIEPDGRAAALNRIKTPATALIVLAILDLLLSLYDLIAMFLFPANLQAYQSLLQQLNDPQMQQMMHRVIDLTSGPLGIASVIFRLAMEALILMGALKMRSLRSYEFSVTAAILSIIPCLTPCCGNVFGIAFGIWALAVLFRPEVKSCFH